MDSKHRVALFTGQDIGHQIVAALASRGDLDLSVYSFETESDRLYGFRSAITECSRQGIRCRVATAVTDEILKEVAAFAPDLLIGAYYAKLFPKALMSIPRLGGVNVHPGLLPLYRGGFPTAWAIVQGETQFGVTMHRLDEGIDTGAIFVQEIHEIRPDETGFELYSRSMTIGAKIVVENLDHVLSGAITPREQMGPGNFFGKFPPRHQISWKSPRSSIMNQVRAHAPPYFPAFSYVLNRCVLFNRVSRVDPPAYSAQGAGQIEAVNEDGTFVVTCADGCLLVEDFTIVPFAAPDKTRTYVRVGARFQEP